MALIHNEPGYILTNSTGSAIAAGTAVVSSKLFGVAASTIENGADGFIAVSGVWSLPAASAATASIGDLAYWDASNAQVTATASTNLPIGYFTEAKTSGSTSAVVLLGAGLQAAAAVNGG